jgi:RsiW-degrading membrane proteinase PrsW (M82 family)
MDMRNSDLIRKVWRVLEALFIFIILIVVGVANFIAFKRSKTNRKKRIWSGVIFLILTPIIFFLTAISISPFDPYGFGTGIISSLYAVLFFINGLVVIFIGLLTKNTTGIT